MFVTSGKPAFRGPRGFLRANDCAWTHVHIFFGFPVYVFTFVEHGAELGPSVGSQLITDIALLISRLKQSGDGDCRVGVLTFAADNKDLYAWQLVQIAKIIERERELPDDDASYILVTTEGRHYTDVGVPLRDNAAVRHSKTVWSMHTP